MSDEPASPILSYSAQTAAAALELEPRTILRACRRGLIKHCKIGNLIRIHHTEVERIAVEGVPGPNSAAVRTSVGLPAVNYEQYKAARKRKPKPPKVKAKDKAKARLAAIKDNLGITPKRKPKRDERRASP